MKDWQKRVVAEKSELDVKIKALGEFIEDKDGFSKIPGQEQDRLLRQAVFMRQYSGVLNERIISFV